MRETKGNNKRKQEQEHMQACKSLGEYGYRREGGRRRIRREEEKGRKGRRRKKGRGE